MKKYRILKTTIIHKNGHRTILNYQKVSNDIEKERTRLKQENSCKDVIFGFQTIDSFPNLKLNPNEEAALFG